MTVQLTPEMSSDLLNLVTARLSGGALLVYAGPRPETPAHPVLEGAVGPHTLLARLPLGSPAFAAAVGGIAPAEPIAERSVRATGRAVFFRCVDVTGRSVLDGDISTLEGDGDLQLSTVRLEENVRLALGSFTLALP